MDAKTARTVNMRRLVAEAGGPAEWARSFGGGRWTQPQVSQWISESAPKGIGHKLARDLEGAMGLPLGTLDRPPEEAQKVASQPQGLDPEILAAALRLVRLAFEILEVEHNPEEDGLPTALAYAYLLKRGQRAVTPENLIDFSKALRARRQGLDEDGQGVGGAGERDRGSGARKRT